MQDNLIHVLYGMTDASGHFSKYPATSIHSVLANTKSRICIHFICDSTLQESNRQKFIELVQSFNQEIIFYNVDKIFPQRMRDLEEEFNHAPKFEIAGWAFGALYRLIAPEILSQDISKVIYFDTDIVLNLDVAELWNIDLTNYPIAAKIESDILPDESPYNLELTEFERRKIDFSITHPKKICDGLQLVRYEDYFASDVMIYNLDLIRKIFDEAETTLIDASLEILTQYPTQYIDQDALNVLFSRNCLHLPAKFNVFIYQIGNYFISKGMPLKLEPWIYHYSGYNQNFYRDNIFAKLWFEHFIRTPFFNVDSMFNLAQDFRSQLDQERLTMQNLLKMATNKNLAIFANQADFQCLATIQF